VLRVSAITPVGPSQLGLGLVWLESEIWACAEPLGMVRHSYHALARIFQSDKSNPSFSVHFTSSRQIFDNSNTVS